jgi:hypothetical protein
MALEGQGEAGRAQESQKTIPYATARLKSALGKGGGHWVARTANWRNLCFDLVIRKHRKWSRPFERQRPHTAQQRCIGHRSDCI